MADLAGGTGDIKSGLAQADLIHEATYQTQRLAHASLESHAAIAWTDANGVLTIRSSTQVPFLVRGALARLLDRDPATIRVLCERVGGGFGGKQEMLVEDVVALATLQTGRPVALEHSRAEQFAATTTRHAMRMRVRVGATARRHPHRPRARRALRHRRHGNHGPGTLFHGCGEAVAIYRCPNKRVTGRVVYTTTPPAGAFRGYGLSQTAFAVESAIDELAAKLGVDPVEFRHRNRLRPGDAIVSFATEQHDVEFGSYGLDQCLDLVRRHLKPTAPTDPTDGWLIGTGLAMSMLDTIPPRGHHSTSRITRHPDGTFELTVGTAEFGNGTSTVHVQLAAAALNTTQDRIRLIQSDTGRAAYDTGAFGSTGTVVAGLATQRAAQALARALATQDHNEPITAEGTSNGTPRSLAFNVQGFRVAVRTRLPAKSASCRAFTPPTPAPSSTPPSAAARSKAASPRRSAPPCTKNSASTKQGGIANPAFRDYHIPTMADLPTTEVNFADTYDRIGPSGAKSMSESPFNPVAPALANAIADATGARLRRTPMRADTVWRALNAAR